jgi:hypothetical protein
MIEMFAYGFKHSPILTTIMALILLLLIVIIAVGVFYAIDAWFLPNLNGEGIVTDKKFTPAHTTTTLVYNAATKTSLPQVTYHDDCWEVTFKVNKMNDTVEVTKEQFNKLSNGDIAKLTYSYGRISSDLYIKECLI